VTLAGANSVVKRTTAEYRPQAIKDAVFLIIEEGKRMRKTARCVSFDRGRII
jgi:hypothetical protein